MKHVAPFLQRGVALGVFLAWACGGAASAATYYVDASGGSDSNTGTAQTRAWQTFSKVNSANLLAGDSVLFKRGEAWRGQLLLTRSGNATSYITYGAYGTGAKPVFNGAQPVTDWVAAGGNLYSKGMVEEPDVVVFDGVKGVRESGLAALDAPNEWYWENSILAIYAVSAPVNIEAASQHFIIAGNNVSYLRIQDIDVRFAADPICMNETRYVTIENVDAHDSAGLSAILFISYTAGKGEHNTVRNCATYNVTGSAESLQNDNNGCGIFLYGEMCKNNTVTSSTAHDCGHEGILILGGSNNLISNNAVYNCSQSGFRVALETATGNVIENNQSYANAQTVDDRYGIDLIRVGNDNIVRYNLVHDQHDTLNDPSIPANDGRSKYGSGGIRFDGGDWEGNDYMDSTGNKAYYNVVYNETTGLLTFNFSNISFYNNTVYNTRSTGLGIISASATIASNNTAVNNAIYTASGQALVRYRATDNHIDCNRYYSAGTVTFSWASAIVNFAAWQTASQLDAHSAAADPLWVNPAAADFHLRSASLCVDTGAEAGLTRDFEGTLVPQRAGVDIGAFELPPPTLTVTTPNGGESFATGQDVTVQWSYAGDPGANVKVELVQGAVSSILASSVPAGTSGLGSWSWAIPLSQAAGNCRIRITSLDYDACSDASDADFTITAPTLTVLAPTGGESWFGGESHTIQWSYTGEPGADVKIELLIGNYPAVLAASVPVGAAGSGQYTWAIPPIQSIGIAYKIRVTSNSNAYCGDTSDAAFSITPASIVAVSPNGGETWYGGEPRTIQWNSAGVPGSTAKIELIKGGVAAELAASVPMGAPGMGAWDWNIPPEQADGSDYRIRITSNDATVLSDTSNADFTIHPASIAIAAPNGGETWIGGETHAIAWSYAGNPGPAVNIELLNAGTPSLLAANVSTGTGGAGSWNWVIPPGITPGTQYRIRVISASAAACSAVNADDFAITAPTIRVSQPIGGESWTTGENRPLQWSYTGVPGPYVKIELLDGVTPQVLAANAPIGNLGAGIWNWQIPFSIPGGSNYFIRVTSTAYAWCGDTGDAPFSITAAPADTLAVLSPDGGETWTPGETHSIQWVYAGEPGANVSIELLDAGVPTFLAASVPIGADGAGSWDWSIPASQVTGTYFRIRVASVDKPACTDTGFGDFTIAAAGIEVMSPNGGEQWFAGETRTIHWNYAGFPGESVRIELLNGGTPQELAADVPIGADGAGSWEWDIPNGQASGADYAVRVSSLTNALYTDTSDASFEIAAPAMALMTPNGGETWIGGETHMVAWNYTGEPGANVQIELLNNGTPSILASSVSIGSGGAGSWSWAVPANQPAGSSYKIRVTSTATPSCAGTSAGSFSIASPAIALITPAGGEAWIGGQTRTIEWNYTGEPGANVQIELLNNGTPSVLASSVSIGSGGAGSWSWAIPASQPASADYKVRVTSTAAPACTGTSPAVFSIAAPAITLTNPNGGNTFTTGGNVNIRWTYTGNPGPNIEIALLDGANIAVLNASVSAGTNGSGAWNWAIPLSQAAGANYRIRLTSTGLPSCTDASDAPFTISAPILTLAAPNGGETWIAGSSHAIQWNYSGNPGANLRIELTNNGVSSVLASSISTGSAGTGSWNWAIPAGYATGSNFAIRISSTTNAYCFDSSDGLFTIAPPPPTIRVSTPNGGETWHTGETREIQWTYTNDPGEYLRIELLQGAAVTVIASNVPAGSGGTGSWDWPIPASQALATNYRVRVTSIDTAACTDASDADFAIAAATQEAITVVSPNGEENWLTWDSHAIIWTYTGNPGPNVRIELLRNGTLASVLAPSVSIGSGGYGVWTWNPSFFLEARNDYAIRITSATTPSVTDISDDFFTVTRWANILAEYPNGGEQWIGGETHTLRWSYAGDVGSSVRIILQRGGTATTLASGVALGSNGQGSWSWAVPADQQPSADYRIRLETNSFFSASDNSDSAFAISAPAITVTAPGAGEQYRIGEAMDIQWAYTGYPGASVKIELIANGGAATLADSVPVGTAGAGSWHWLVPSSMRNAAGCQIRVTSVSLTSCAGTSAGFDILAPEIDVITPNGGEDWKCGEAREILWDYANGPGATVRIELLDDGAASILAEHLPVGENGTGAWLWAVPVQQPCGTRYTIRITSESNASCSDESDVFFQISLAPPQIREIVIEPDNAKAISGDALQMTVYLDAGTPPFTYQWYKDGGELADSNTPTYSLDPARPADSGAYTCRVTNAAGSDLSAPVTIHIAEPLVFTLPPCGGQYLPGASHLFAAAVTGGFGPYAFEWRKEGEESPISLESSFEMDNLDHANCGRYYVIVVDSEGDAVESAHVMLTVRAATPALGIPALLLLAFLLLWLAPRILRRA